jgi:hypothetical protein
MVCLDTCSPVEPIPFQFLHNFLVKLRCLLLVGERKPRHAVFKFESVEEHAVGVVLKSLV